MNQSTSFKYVAQHTRTESLNIQPDLEKKSFGQAYIEEWSREADKEKAELNTYT